MVRKDAINYAIIKLQKSVSSEELIRKLSEISEMIPFTVWSEKLVKECVDEFIIQNGRLPLKRELRVCNKLPDGGYFWKYLNKDYWVWCKENYEGKVRPRYAFLSALNLAWLAVGKTTKEGKKIKEIIDEFPVARWTDASIKDGVERFISENGKLPTEDDFAKSFYLPYKDIFLSRYKMKTSQWLEHYCGDIIKEQSKNIVCVTQDDYISAFVNEYCRIKPISEYEYNVNRNKAMSFSSTELMSVLRVSNWFALLRISGLSSDYFKGKTVALVTRKYAVQKAIELLEATDSSNEVVLKLKKVLDLLPFSQWKRELVIDAIITFSEEHGRLPQVREFEFHNNLPHQNAFKKLFGVTSYDWLKYSISELFNYGTTIKRALEIAIEILAEYPDLQLKIEEIINDYPTSKWTESNINDVISEFYNNNGRLPNSYDFKTNKELPTPALLRKGFSYNIKEWLTKYFPDQAKEEKICIYDERQNRDYIEDFKAEYERIKPFTQKEYDDKYDNNVAYSSEVIKSKIGVRTWVELLKKLSLTKYKPEVPRTIRSYSVIVI